VVPRVIIGGFEATVQFAGLAPGFVGLYQVNVQVPANIPSGNTTLVLSVDTAAAAPATVPVR
jgi:minor extracellular serine protease Vpr